MLMPVLMLMASLYSEISKDLSKKVYFWLNNLKIKHPTVLTDVYCFHVLLILYIFYATIQVQK